MIEEVAAPNYLLRCQGRVDGSNAVCKNHTAAPQTTADLEANDGTAQLRKY